MSLAHFSFVSHVLCYKNCSLDLQQYYHSPLAVSLYIFKNDLMKLSSLKPDGWVIPPLFLESLLEAKIRIGRGKEKGLGRTFSSLAIKGF